MTDVIPKQSPNKHHKKKKKINLTKFSRTKPEEKQMDKISPASSLQNNFFLLQNKSTKQVQHVSSSTDQCNRSYNKTQSQLQSLNAEVSVHRNGLLFMLLVLTWSLSRKRPGASAVSTKTDVDLKEQFNIQEILLFSVFSRVTGEDEGPVQRWVQARN